MNTRPELLHLGVVEPHIASSASMTDLPKSPPMTAARRRRQAVKRYSNAKIRFQSFFMLMIIQPSFFASSYSAWVNVPTFVSGSPLAGP